MVREGRWVVKYYANLYGKAFLNIIEVVRIKK